MTNISQKQQGQVLLIILGAIALGLTLGLAIASRSTVDVGLSRKLEESAKAFSAAEAGVEDLLKSPLDTGSRQLTFTKSVATIQALPTPAPDTIYEYPDVVAAGDAQTVWFVNHQTTTPYDIDETTEAYAGNRIYICWSPVDPSKVAGLEVSIFYRDDSAGGAYRVARRAYKYGGQSCPNGAGSEVIANDCFDGTDVIIPTSSNACNGYKYEKLVNFQNSFGAGVNLKNDTIIKLYARLRPYGDSVKVAVKSDGGTLPRQAVVDALSVGQSSSGGETAKIRVFQGYPVAPSVFDYVLYSGSAIIVPGQ